MKTYYPTFHHLGRDVWGIYGLFIRSESAVPLLIYGSQTIQSPTLIELEQNLKNFKRRYVFAVSANMHQKPQIEILKNANFEEIVTFYSNHGKHENLTLWFKEDKDAPDLSKNAIESYPATCSCRVTREYRMQCDLTVKRKDETEETLNAFNFKRIKKTPLFYRIAPGALVKEGVYLFPELKSENTHEKLSI